MVGCVYFTLSWQPVSTNCCPWDLHKWLCGKREQENVEDWTPARRKREGNGILELYTNILGRLQYIA